REPGAQPVLPAQREREVRTRELYGVGFAVAAKHGSKLAAGQLDQPGCLAGAAPVALVRGGALVQFLWGVFGADRGQDRLNLGLSVALRFGGLRLVRLRPGAVRFGGVGHRVPPLLSPSPNPRSMVSRFLPTSPPQRCATSLSAASARARERVPLVMCVPRVKATWLRVSLRVPGLAVASLASSPRSTAAAYADGARPAGARAGRGRLFGAASSRAR